MAIKVALPFYAAQKISPFLNSIISADHEKKGTNFSQLWSPWAPYCLSREEYLLSLYSWEPTVGENIIATIKMRNNFCYPLKL